MEHPRDPTLALRRVGFGLVAGAALLLVLASVVLAELAALLVAVVGLATYALERRSGAVTGLSVGMVVAGLLLIADRQLDPLGATVPRSAAATVAIGVGIVLATLVVEADPLGRRDPE